MIVGIKGTIKEGKLSGITGKVVGADYLENIVTIRIDKLCTIETVFENVSQEDAK